LSEFQERTSAGYKRLSAERKVLEDIRGMSDEGAWKTAAVSIEGKSDAEKFIHLVELFTERTDVTFWRKYIRMSKRVVSVHYTKFESGTLRGALAKAWLWSEFIRTKCRV
jgi:hypothetical protein